MKAAKIFCALTVLFSLTAVSCSDDDDNDTALELNTTKVSLHQDDTKQMTVKDNRSVTWTVDDDFVARVDEDGLLTAQYVGETRVKATDSKGKSATASVVVNPRYNTYKEPCVEWGASKSAVLAYDTREVSSEDETSVILTGGSDAAELVSYTFDETGLKGAVVIVKTSYSAEMVKFLGERYKYLGEDNDIFMFSNKDVAVGMKVQSYKYLAIAYIPNTTNKSLSLTQAELLMSAFPAFDE